jgi:hypothetical protein
VNGSTISAWDILQHMQEDNSVRFLRVAFKYTVEVPHMDRLVLEMGTETVQCLCLFRGAETVIAQY